MDATSYTLLDDARGGNPQSWKELDRLYRPFVVRELRRVLFRFHDSDADDIAQEVFKVLFLRLSSFHSRGPGSFRAFLREITRRQALGWLKCRTPEQLPAGFHEDEVVAGLNQWADAASDLSRLWDDEHRRYWAQRVWEEAERRCQSSKKLARYFPLYGAVKLRGQAISEAASELGMSLPTAYRALSEVQAVINEVRREWGALMDLEDS